MEQPDYDPIAFDPTAYTTVRDAADSYGVSEAAVRQWIKRRGIEAAGRYPWPDNRRIYLVDDLVSAELATRARARDRGVPELAGWQRRHRAERAAERRTA